MDKGYNHYREQLIGTATDIINTDRIAKEAGQLNLQENALVDALKEVNKIRERLATPEHILGSSNTKHGEIAEIIEVNIRNARSLLEQKPPVATFEGVGRTAPEDYLVDGIAVQSKFINGLNNTLDHILHHMDQYKNFGRDGSYYNIPRDIYKSIIDIKNGEITDELAGKTINKVIEKVRAIESCSKHSFEDIIKPSISEYGEVQKGVIFKTVNGHEEKLQIRNKEIKDDISDAHGASIGEALKAGAYGAAIGGGFSAALCVYEKHKEGKAIYDYNRQDWIDVGLDFGKGGIKGSITGIAIYGITNFTDLGAPLASSFVSASFGISSLIKSYKMGNISKEQFAEQGQVVCFDSATIAIGATVGQALIPIPIVGVLIGTFASKTCLSICKKTFDEETRKIQEILDKQYNDTLSKIDKEYKMATEEIIAKYEGLGSITKMAFNFDRNAVFRFEMSIELATSYNVARNKILKNNSDVDNYILS
ncbi:MAG: hypothetical protein HOG49_09655 [Candidatus Scalindua sp.]|jgi:hypothetical protein|nr:hypothetical protein [Candidatus Scalindua sp.]